MAAVAKSGTPSLSTAAPSFEHRLSLTSGDTIAAGDACYIASSGLVMRSSGAAANAAAVVDGFACGAAVSGGPVTLAHGVEFYYGAGLTPGAPYYLSGTTAGGLDTAASTGGTVIVARAVDDTRIAVRRSW